MNNSPLTIPAWKKRLYYLIAATFLLYEMAVQTSSGIMALPMMQELHIDAAVLGLIMGMYFYSYTLMQIPVGLILDRRPTSHVLTFAVLTCAAGNLLFYLSSHLILLAAARFLMGLGSAFAFVGVLITASEWFQAKHFALLAGIAQLLGSLGAILGVLPLAYLVNHYHWQLTSAILAFIGLILALLLLLIMRNPPKQTTRTTSTPITQSLRKILQSPQTYWIACYAFCSWAPVTLFAELWGIPYLIQRFNIPNTTAALGITTLWVFLAIFSPLLGWLSDRLQQRTGLLKYMALLGFACSLIMLYGPHSLLLCFFLLAGIGAATASQILTFALIKDHHPTDNIAAAIGFNNMAVVAGGALFQPLVGLFLKLHSHSTHSHSVIHYSNQDYRLALSAIPLCFIIGAWLATYRLKEARQ